MEKNKMYCKIAGFVLILLFGFLSCEKFESVKIMGFVQGYVYDATSNEVLDNVTITWYQTDGTAYSTTSTASEGFVIKNLISGKYTLECSKENYATSTIQVEIPEDAIDATIRGGGTKEYMTTVSPKLHSLTANVKGRIYKYDQEIFLDKYSPAKIAKVKLIYPNNPFIKSVYEAVTDNNGYYTFTNVPVGKAYILAPDFVDEYQLNYWWYSTSNYTLNDGNNTIKNITMLPSHNFFDDPIFLTGSNLFIAPNVSTEEFPLNSNITLTFNRKVSLETLQFIFGSFYPIFRDQSNNDVDFTISVNENVVTIDPVSDLNPNEEYLLASFIFGERIHDLCTVDITFTTASAK